jgi:hypothetical protein
MRDSAQKSMICRDLAQISQDEARRIAANIVKLPEMLPS